MSVRLYVCMFVHCSVTGLYFLDYLTFHCCICSCIHLRSSGIIQKWKMMYWPPKRPCSRFLGKEIVVRFKDVQILFVGLFTALSIACLVFIYEIIANFCTGKTNQRKQTKYLRLNNGCAWPPGPNLHECVQCQFMIAVSPSVCTLVSGSERLGHTRT